MPRKRSLDVLAAVPVALLLCAASAVVLLCFVMFANRSMLFDSYWSRQQAAQRIQALAARVRDNPGDRDALGQIEATARSGYSFQRCYALGTLGDLGDLASSALPTLVDGLKSSDGFVRDAAAHALADWGKAACPAKDALVRTVKGFANESAGMYAAEALGHAEEASPDVLDALQFAALSSESLTFTREEARRSYQRLTGHSLSDDGSD